MKQLFILFILFLSGASHAVTWSAATDFLWNAGTGKIETFPGQGSGNVWSINDVKPSTAGPTIERQKALPFNPSPTATFKSTITPKAIAKGLLNPASAAITLVGAALINRALETACLRVFGGAMQIAPGGQWEECKYKEVSQFEINSGIRAYGSTPADTCGAWVSKNSTTYPNTSQPHRLKYLSSTNDICNYSESVGSYCYDTGGACYWTSPVDRVALIYPSGTPGKTFDGWQPTTADKAQVALEPVIEQWSQADFSYGRQGSQSDVAQLLDKIIESKNSVEVEKTTVTGPSSSPGTETTTKNETGDPATSTTTKTTTTNNYKYEQTGPNTTTITNNVTTTTTTTNNSTNSVINTTTTDSQPKPSEDYGTSDTGLVDLPELYKPKYKDGIKGVWDMKKAEFKTSPLFSLPSLLMPNIGSGGTCPVWNLNLDVGIGNYGVHDISPPCWLWGVAKAVIIISALILARALVFGG